MKKELKDPTWPLKRAREYMESHPKEYLLKQYNRFSGTCYATYEEMLAGEDDLGLLEFVLANRCITVLVPELRRGKRKTSGGKKRP